MSGRNPSALYGETEIIKKPRGKKYERTVRFLDSTVGEYARFNTAFYRTMKMGELTLGWGEAQNQSVIWHSMAKSGLSESGYRVLPFSEHLYRLRGKNRRLDYRVLLRDAKTVLWMEYKHATAFVSRKNRFDLQSVAINSLDAVAGRWEKDIERLQAMTREGCEDLFLSSPSDGWHTVKVNLLVLPVCRRIAKSKGERLSREEKTTVGQQILRSWAETILQWWEMKTAPNFIAVWSLHNDLQLMQSWPDPKKKDTLWWDAYHGVYFFAWLDMIPD